jgi:hypothetical protein
MALRPSSSTRELLERTCSVTKNGRRPEPYTQTKLVTNGFHVSYIFQQAYRFAIACYVPL